MTNLNHPNEPINDQEILMLSGIFTNLKHYYRLILNSNDLKYYKSIETKLKDIKKHTIEGEEFQYLINFTIQFKKQLIHNFDKDQLIFYENVIKKLEKLQEKNEPNN